MVIADVITEAKSRSHNGRITFVVRDPKQLRDIDGNYVPCNIYVVMVITPNVIAIESLSEIYYIDTKFDVQEIKF